MYSQLICLLLVLPALSSQVIRPLIDGLIVEKGEDLRVEEGLWTVLITLKGTGQDYESNEIAALHKMATSLKQKISEQQTDELVTQRKKLAWIQRLDLLLQNNSITIDYMPRRQKRGLIDIGGTILNKVFGVATQAQVDQVNAALEYASRQGRVVTHHVNQLITIVNNTQMEERATRKKLNDLIFQVKLIHEEEYHKWQSFNGIAKAQMIDELLSMLESIDEALQREIRIESDIKETLENEQLTEFIFPEQLLKDIANKAEEFSSRALSSIGITNTYR
jgi:hypothetical protein